MKIASLVAVFLVVVFLPAHATEDLGDFYVVADVLNVRSEPTTSGDIVDRLYRGQTVAVDERRGAWARVSEPGHLARWVHANYLARERPKPRMSSIPADVAYTVIDSQIIPGIKRGLDVRLNRKVSKAVLRAIALELKARDPRKHERTFIVYLLPEMRVGAGAWATTHFNPDLTVEILGLTIAKGKALIDEPIDIPSHRIIGAWIDERHYASSKITIYQAQGRPFLQQRFGDGSKRTKELVERPSPDGRKFEMKEGSPSGDHFLIDRQGNLQLRDQDGLISIAR